MSILESIILGVVQGITEFLPISSSGHLALFEAWFQINQPSLIFTLSVHVATLFSIVLFFGKSLWQVSRQQLLAIGIGTVPILIVGFLLRDNIDGIFSQLWLVGSCFLITAGLNFAADAVLKRNKTTQQKQQSSESEVSFIQALKIGLGQMVAILPGISRSGSSVATGLFVGLNREKAFTFSFQLAIPAIVMASGWQFLQVIREPSIGFDGTIFTLVIGSLCAAITGYFSLLVLKKAIVQAKLSYFGWYCLGISLVTFATALG